MASNKKTIHYVTSLAAVSGFLLSSVRSQLGLQQNELAKIFNIAQATYGNMERGEAAINVDFIYMLCSIAKIKFSDYFSIVDEIVNEFELPQSIIEDEEIKISLIPSTDFQKILTDPEAKYNIASIFNKDSNILTVQDFNLLLSKETLINIRRLTTVNFKKEDVEKMMKATVSDLEAIENKYSENESDVSGGIMSYSMVSISTSTLGSYLAKDNPILGALGLAGYSLFKAHKKTKEVRKAKRA